MNTFKKYILLQILVLLLLSITDVYSETLTEASNEATIQIAQFSESDLDGWESKSFEGNTKFIIKNEGQKHYLHAESVQSASALYKKVKVNIYETPFLNWTWRIDKALPMLNEQTKNGDDYAARIYVVFKTGFTPLSAKALNYVWSSANNPDTYWPNAYTEKAIMIPLRSNQDKTNLWQKEKVNIKEDLLKYFDKLPRYIDGIAIMTDTDNSKGIASASYGDIHFSSK
jgi:hypothetical protein